ncbi:hypothetical protein C0993_004908, partial [Termitomyces sp. T159_Od127]
MKEWVSEIFIPYIQCVIAKDPDLDEHQKAIVFLDVYYVHKLDTFRAHVFKEYPNVILIFVPGNCTGTFQPADVSLQHIVKHMLKQQTVEYMLSSHKEQLQHGITLESVKIINSIGPLHNATVAGLVHVYNFMQTLCGQELVKK